MKLPFNLLGLMLFASPIAATAQGLPPDTGPAAMTFNASGVTFPDTDGKPGESVWGGAYSTANSPEYQNSNNAAIFLLSHVSDPDVVREISYRLSDTNYGSCSGGYNSIACSFLGEVPDGINMVELSVRDAAGKVTTKEFQFTVMPSVPGSPRVNQPPTATIVGGDRTIVDTDLEPGEYVTVYSQYSDDTYVIGAHWELDGKSVMAGDGEKFQLFLHDGPHALRFVVTDEDKFSVSASISITVTAPRSEPFLPILTGYSTIDGPSPSLFAVGLKTDSATGPIYANTTDSAAISHVYGYFLLKENDENHTGDLFVVIVTKDRWFMLDANGYLLPWSGSLDMLVPAYESVELTYGLEAPIYTGVIPPDTYRIFLGYKRTDSLELVYSGTAGLLLVTQK